MYINELVRPVPLIRRKSLLIVAGRLSFRAMGSYAGLRILAWSVGLLCALLPAAGQATQPTVRADPDYLIDTWQTDDGLPENSATAMVQDRDGYLWFGTFRGLVRFDGVDFTRYDPINTPALPSEGIVNLHLDRSGRLWISTLRGVAVRDGPGWRTVAAGDGWPSDPVRTFAERPGGDLLLTTFNGLTIEYVGGRFRQLPPPPPPGRGGYFGHADEQGRWCVVRNDFIGCWDGTRWTPLPALGEGATGCATARDGGLWLLRDKSLIRYSRGVEVRRVDLPEAPGSLWSMSEDGRGNVWIATYDRGLVRVSAAGEFRRWDTAHGLAYDGTRFAFEDAEGDVWIGTSGGGLQRFKPRRFWTIGIEEGLPERVVRSVCAAPDGSLWIGTYGKGLFRLQNGKVENVPLPGWTGDSVYVQSVLADRAGRIWVGTFGQGLWLREQETFRRIPFDQTGGENVIMLFQDSHGRVWINGGRGIAVYETGAFRSFPTTESAPSQDVRFAEDGEGTVWVASPAGVDRLVGGHFAEVTEHGNSIRGAYCLAGDAAGSVWIAAPNDTLLCYRGGTMLRVGAAAGLPPGQVQAILDDARGYLWIATDRGVLRASREQLLASAAGGRGPVTYQTFDPTDGLPSVETPRGCQPTCARDRDGRLWFATSKGVAMTDPVKLRVGDVPPPVHVQSMAYSVPSDGPRAKQSAVAASGETAVSLAAPFEGPLRLPAGSRRLEIKYAALSFAAPGKVRYQVRLDDVDTDWQDVGNQRTAYYYAPRPGRYVFRVRAAGGDGVWNAAGASLPFSVEPYFWQTSWFLAGVGAALAGASAGVAWRVSYLRHRRARARLEHRQEQAAALLKLAASPALMAGDLPRAFREIAEVVGPALGVWRVCVSTADDRGDLWCAEAVGGGGGDDARGNSRSLAVADYPAYFRALHAGRAVDAARAATDPRTAELAPAYFRPRRIESVLEAPARAQGRVVGTVRFEHRGPPRVWREDEVAFAGAVADQLAQALLNAERERTHRELRESEERFRLLADAAPVMVWRSGVDGLRDFVNKQWLTFTGRTMEQEVRDGWSTGVHPDDLDECLHTYVRAFRGRQPFQMEYRLHRLDGEYRWVLDTGVPRSAGDGSFAGYIGSCVDITERKQADDTLRQSEERFRLAVDAAPSAMLMVAEDGTIAFANAQAEQVFGYSRAELLGMYVERLIPSRFRAYDRTMRREFFSNPQPQATPPGRDLTALRKDGSEIPVEVGFGPVRNREGLFILAVVVDITARVRAEAEAQQQRAELAHLSRVTMLGELSGSLAHELNQPLTAILSNAQAAQRFLAAESPALGEIREILKDIVEEDKRAGEVIRRLRLLLKKGEVSFQPLCLNDVVLDVLRLVRSDLLNHGVTVETDLAPELPDVSGDRVQIQQVLLNLVMNACDAVGGNDGADRSIVIRTCRKDDGSVATTVSDCGHGIPPDQMQKVFEPFFTTQSHGMGLGLAVCRTIVAAHGGSLSAENNAGVGASFQLTLRPAGVAHEPEQPTGHRGGRRQGSPEGDVEAAAVGRA
jgi:PAS domain S-box-containing protein